MARLEPGRPLLAKTAKAPEPFCGLAADHPLYDMTGKEAVPLRLSEDGTAEFSAAEEYLAALFCAKDEASRAQRGVPLLYAGAVMLRFSEEGLRVNAPALLIPARIERKSREPAKVFVRFEDAEPNGPLFDLLRRRFGLAPKWPPYYREGLNGIKAALLALKQAVRPGWGVYDEIALSLFDLSDWHVYEDGLSRAEQIALHPLAGALFGKTQPFSPAALPGPDEGEALALPLFADAAQKTAVRAASMGNSLILSGKAGTGKTFAAANAALHALYAGKTVLYAARSGGRKKAFLDLLEENGARGFCLDLGGELPRREMEQVPPPEGFLAAANRLKDLAARCDAMGAPAVAVRSCGLRFYELVEACEALSGAPDAVRFSAEDAARVRWDSFVHWKDLCGQLEAAGRAVGHPAGHPLLEIRQKFYSKAAGEEASALLESAAELAEQAQDAAVFLAAQWNLPRPAKRAEFEQLGAMAAAAAQWEKLPQEWLQAEDMAAFLAKVKELIAKGKRVSETRTRLLCTFAEPALAADAEGLAAQWAEAEKSLVSRATVQGRLFKEIAAMVRHGVRLDKKQIPGLLAAISAYQKDVAALQKLLPELSGLLSSFWKDVYTDWIKVEGYCRTAQSVHDALMKALGSPQACTALYHRAAASGDLSAAKRFDAAWKRLADTRDRLFGLLDVEDRFDESDLPYPLALAEAFSRWNAAKGMLKEWMNWRLDREKAVDAGLSAVVDAYEQGLPHDGLVPAFERGLYAALAGHVLDGDPALREFSAASANALLDGLCELDERVRRESKRAIAAALRERMPAPSPDELPYSEPGMFQKAMAERDPSLYRMFERMPGLMPRRFPAVAASVAEAARLPRSALFDLVIVDGADALDARTARGLLSRGRACIAIERGEAQNGSLSERLRAIGLPEIALKFDYAQLQAEDAVSDAARKSVRHTESGVLAALAEALGSAGWQCRFFAGRPGMLVMNRSRPVVPLLCVMTDGPELRELTLSDRELSRAQPLRRAGYRVHRFWYARWWKDRDGAVGDLLEQAQRAQREADLEAAKRRLAPAAPKEEPAPKPPPKEQENAAAATMEKTPGAAIEDAVSARATGEQKFQPRPYVQASLAMEPLRPQEVFDPGRAMLFKAKLAEAVAQEAPIAKTLLVKRVLAACGIRRAGARMVRAVGELAEELDFPKSTDPDTGETFFFSRAEPPERFFAYRTASPEEMRRDASEIPRQEAANAVCAALQGRGAVQDIQLAREAAYLMGFLRLGAALQDAMLRGVAEAHRRGDIATDDGVRFRLAKRQH